MRLSVRHRPIWMALAFLILPLVSGCGGNPFNPDTGGGGDLPANTPLNTTPENTVARFAAVYKYKKIDLYQQLFTSDFRFTFSSQSDPTLASQYQASGWGKDDEVESTSHLFTGFTQTESPFETYSPPSNIELTLNGPQFLDDLIRPDSAAFYRYVIVPQVLLSITVIKNGIETTYEIDAPHDLYLVRGDVALLDADQPATADRWYIYRWDDKSPAPPAAKTPRISSLASETPALSTSWGKFKAVYVPTP